MIYDNKKIEEGFHELMKMRVGELEKALDSNMPQPISMVKAIQSYRTIEMSAREFISTSNYERKFDNLLENFKSSLDKPYVNRKLKEFNLTPRARQVLRRKKLLESSVANLAQKTKEDLLIETKGCGKKTLQELRKILTDGGLDFKDYRK